MKNKLCNASVLPALLVLALLASGCQLFKVAPVLPGNDAAVVNTERVSEAALASFKAVTEFDHENLDLMKAKLPKVHDTIQQLRKDFPIEYEAVRDATKKYKQSRLPEDAKVMNDKLLSVTRLQATAQQSLAVATRELGK